VGRARTPTSPPAPGGAFVRQLLPARCGLPRPVAASSCRIATDVVCGGRTSERGRRRELDRRQGGHSAGSQRPTGIVAAWWPVSSWDRAVPRSRPARSGPPFCVFSNRRVVHEQLAGHEHVAVVIDGVGGRLGELCIPANGGGYQGLLGSRSKAWSSAARRYPTHGVEPTLDNRARAPVQTSRAPRFRRAWAGAQRHDLGSGRI
jgi:hypothetical protein